MADPSYEVDEQLRSARFQYILRRGWPYAAGLVVVALLVALAAWGLNQHEQVQAAKASQTYASAGQKLEKNDLDGADRDFGEVARSGPRVYRALAYLQQAGIRLTRHDARAALPMLDQAAQLAPNVILADAARLEAAYAAMDGGAYADVRGRLMPLTAPGRPYRLMAHEALGLEELANGHIAQARGDFQVASLSSDVTEAARNRASAALALIQSGAWTSIAPLAKASENLAPQVQPTQVQPTQAQPALAPTSGGGPQGTSPPQSEPQPGAAQ